MDDNKITKAKHFYIYQLSGNKNNGLKMPCTLLVIMVHTSERPSL